MSNSKSKFNFPCFCVDLPFSKIDLAPPLEKVEKLKRKNQDPL